MGQQEIHVLGVGNAIVDVLSTVDDAYLERRGLPKGSMQLIDAERADALYGQIEGGVQCSGGSAANTIAGLLSLGSRAAYIGKVAGDELGRAFVADIRRTGAEFRTRPLGEGPGTARCLIYVTPDAQRTMMTFLGASALLTPEDIDEELVRRARVTYLEGYLFDPPPAQQAFVKAAELAHAGGNKVALSLSDSFCVDRHRGEFRELVERHVDVLFANEDEIVSLYEAANFDEAAEAVAGRCEIAALTRGARGAVVLGPGERVEIPVAPVERVVDTTGAGDLFAAGFLHGLTAGKDLAASGRLGALASSEIISHYGARPERSLAELAGKSLG